MQMQLQKKGCTLLRAKERWVVNHDRWSLSNNDLLSSLECKDFPTTICTEDPINVKKNVPIKVCFTVPIEKVRQQLVCDSKLPSYLLYPWRSAWKFLEKSWSTCPRRWRRRFVSAPRLMNMVGTEEEHLWLRFTVVTGTMIMEVNAHTHTPILSLWHQ